MNSIIKLIRIKWQQKVRHGSAHAVPAWLCPGCNDAPIICIRAMLPCRRREVNKKTRACVSPYVDLEYFFIEMPARSVSLSPCSLFVPPVLSPPNPTLRPLNKFLPSWTAPCRQY